MTAHKESCPETLYWKDNSLYLLDQRLLPSKVEYRCCRTCYDVVESIKNMTVRGAPAIGIAAAYGLALAAREALDKGESAAGLLQRLSAASKDLSASRPTAVNLTWALKRVAAKIEKAGTTDQAAFFKLILKEAGHILSEDRDNNRLIGTNGQALIPQNASILTHCNAGALATGGYGTALGVIRAAAEAGKAIEVFAGETRPLLQGARLTAFELDREKIPVTLVTDSCAGYLMSAGRVDLVLVGADRIAASGDTANKIGTYSLAVLALYHRIPFYVAAPLSTIDLSLNSGQDIVIEERCDSEVTGINGKTVAPGKVAVFNPAFDLTPAALITAIVTEKGVIQNPGTEKLYKLAAKGYNRSG